MLNDTGAFIYGKLQKGATPDETARALTEEYDVASTRRVPMYKTQSTR